MTDVLVIDCCIRREVSRTRELMAHFISLLEARGDCRVETLCLMDEQLAHFADGFFLQRERLLAEGALDHPRFRYAHRFQQADRIVIAAPFWDLSFPALLKVYIENLCVEGITFGCNESGCYGTCRATRMLFLTTRGGAYASDPMEMGARYLNAMCAFFGIPRFDCIAADGLDLGIEPPEQILARAMRQAADMAISF